MPVTHVTLGPVHCSRAAALPMMNATLIRGAIVPSQEMTDTIELIASGPAMGDGTIEEQRATMAAMLEGSPLPANLSVNEIRIGGMTADWIAMPNSSDARVVLFLLGGGYVMGSNRTHRELAARIAQAAAARVLVSILTRTDSRLSPHTNTQSANDSFVAKGEV
jgi:acetyl esterase/lipase